MSWQEWVFNVLGCGVFVAGGLYLVLYWGEKAFYHLRNLFVEFNILCSYYRFSRGDMDYARSYLLSNLYPKQHVRKIMYAISKSNGQTRQECVEILERAVNELKDDIAHGLS